MEAPSDLKHLFVDYLARIEALEKRNAELKTQVSLLTEKCVSYSQEVYDAKKLHLFTEMKLLKLKILTDQLYRQCHDEQKQSSSNTATDS
jgi:hypothetical protein